MKDEVKNWIEFAREDLRMAELALNERLYNQVCFHSEQCAEKVLKGIIIHEGRIHPQTHKLADLLNNLSEGLFQNMRDEIISLDRFYIPTRYPDVLPGILSDGLPTIKDAEEAIKIARQILKGAEEELRKA